MFYLVYTFLQNIDLIIDKQIGMESDPPANNNFHKEFPILYDRTGLNGIKCKNGKKGQYVCFKRQCQNCPFMCNQKQYCSCIQDHEKCFKLLLQNFLDKFQNKIVDTFALIQQNDKLIDLLVQKIVNQTTKIKKSFKTYVQLKSKAMTFNDQELQILRCIQNNDVKNLKGKNFYKIYNQMQQEQKHQNRGFINLKAQNQQNKKNWNDCQNLLNQQLGLIQKSIKYKILELQKQRPLLQNSKIVITIKENYDLKCFFTKKIKKTELLYRASQNNFKLKPFKDNCYGFENTLTLIETQYGKKVGGFTPLIWDDIKQPNGKLSEIQRLKLFFTADTQNQTFIFSLTQNQRFHQKDNTKSGIFNDPIYGPTFGNSYYYYDIRISQSANNNTSSQVSFNDAYKNPKFKQRNHQNHLKFNGSRNNQQYVKIKQWQVWKITFQHNSPSENSQCCIF